MSQYDMVLAEVAEFHGVTVEELRGRSKCSPLPAARRGACMRLRALGLSLPAIARQLGGRHHTTVLHYLRCGRRTGPADAWRAVGNA